MEITTTTKYQWYDFNEQYSVKCYECKREYKRTITSGCNELADQEYIENLKQNLKNEASRLSRKNILCNKCKKGKIEYSYTEERYSIAPIKLQLKKIEDVNSKITDYIKQLKEKIKGGIIIHKGDEWCVWSVDYWDARISLCLYKVNKHKPWKSTQIIEDVWFDSISEIVVIDRIENREKQIKGAKNGHNS